MKFYHFYGNYLIKESYILSVISLFIALYHEEPCLNVKSTGLKYRVCFKFL